MEILWVVLITALLSFCLLTAYRIGCRKGFKDGASSVLVAWKETLDDEEGS